MSATEDQEGSQPDRDTGSASARPARQKAKKELGKGRLDGVEKFLAVSLIVGGVLNALAGSTLIAIGAALQASLDRLSTLVTEMMFTVMRAEVIAGIVVGAALLLITIVTGVLVSCPSRPFYIVYVVILPIMLMAQLALYITYLVGRASFYSSLLATWLGNLQSYFTDVYSSSSTTLNSNSFAYLWNQMMAQQQCCGVNSASDYQSATNWKGSVYAVTNSSGSTTYLSESVPVWCCKMTSSNAFPTPSISDTACLTSPSSANSYSSINCYSALLNAIPELTFHILYIVFWALAMLPVAWLAIAGVVALASGRVFPFFWNRESDKNGRRGRNGDSADEYFDDEYGSRAKIYPSPRYNYDYPRPPPVSRAPPPPEQFDQTAGEFRGRRSWE